MNRLAFALLGSVFLASATAGNAETNAGPLVIFAEGLTIRVPEPDGFFRIDDLEADTPVREGYRRLVVLAPEGVTQQTTMGIPTTVIEVLLYLETATNPVSLQSFADARGLLLEKYVGRAERDSLTLPPDDPHCPGLPWRETDDRWCAGGYLVPPRTIDHGNPLDVPLSCATGAVLVHGAVVQISFARNPSNEEEDARLREESVRYLREFVALNPVAEAVFAGRTPVVSLNGFGRLSNDASPRARDGDNGESRRKTGIMLEIVCYLVAIVLMTFVLLFIRKRLLWRYTRFDDFNWNGSTKPRMPGSKTEIWIESLPREEQEDGAAQPRIDLECSKDGVLMLNGCLSEIHELFCYENRNKTANRFDFEKDIGLPMSETDALRSRIGSAYEEGKDRMTTWRFRFRREELVAILNSIHKLISPRSSLLWELGIRTGFDPDEFSVLADRIQTILNESANPQTDSGR